MEEQTGSYNYTLKVLPVSYFSLINVKRLPLYIVSKLQHFKLWKLWNNLNLRQQLQRKNMHSNVINNTSKVHNIQPILQNIFLLQPCANQESLRVGIPSMRIIKSPLIHLHRWLFSILLVLYCLLYYII